MGILEGKKRLRVIEQGEGAVLEPRVPAHAGNFSSAASGCLLGG